MGASQAQAQTGDSVVQGGVVDAVSRQPVAEAIITVTSPALQGEQTVLTDSSGFYRAPSLPPGVYTVRVDKDGLRLLRAEERQHPQRASPSG